MSQAFVYILGHCKDIIISMQNHHLLIPMMNTIISIKYVHKSSILLAPIMVYNTTIKRTIMSRLYGQGHHGIKTATNTGLPKTMLQRGYPGNFKVSRIKSTLTDNEKQRLGITEHEAKHLNLIDQKTEKVEGILTSAQNKNKNATGGYFCKIDPVKVNGTYGVSFILCNKDKMCDTG